MTSATDNRTTELRAALIRAAEEIGSNERFGITVYRVVAEKRGCTWVNGSIGHLDGIPVSSIDELSRFKESELRTLYGIGDKAIAVIRFALQESGYDFTPEHAMLTAEQVRELVWASSAVIYEDFCNFADEIDWQDIADELNAALGGTCRMTEHNELQPKGWYIHYWECSKCGNHYRDNLPPNYCPNCGARIEVSK